MDFDYAIDDNICSNPPFFNCRDVTQVCSITPRTKVLAKSLNPLKRVKILTQSARFLLELLAGNLFRSEGYHSINKLL